MMYYTPKELLEYIIAKSDAMGRYEPVANSATFMLDAPQALAKPAYRFRNMRKCFGRHPRYRKGRMP